jgi:Subtilase family
MDNWIVVTDGRSIAAVEKQLAKYLHWLDVRLFPLSERRAVLRGPLRKALSEQYPAIPAAAMLLVLGLESWRQISDDESATMLLQRDAVDLPPRRPASRAVAKASVAAGVDSHLVAVNLPTAWAMFGGPAAIKWGAVKAGQIDTGYLRHPAFGFEPAPWLDVTNGATFFPPAAAPELGDLSGPGGGQDNGQGLFAGHGTRIGSAVCGQAPAAPGGPFYGAAPGLPLVPVRITDIVLISHAQAEFLEAVDHLLAQGVAVINVSMGMPALMATRPLRQAVNRCYDAGTLLVCAAGNIVNKVVAPACFPRAIAVAGVGPTGKPWSGSSFGSEVAFSAPADQIRRAQVKGTLPIGYVGGGDGTSYAAALTTGTAALWLTHRGPEIAARYQLPWQRIEAFRMLARQTSSRPPGWVVDGGFGAGILDAGALLAAALPDVALLKPAAAA